MERDLGNLLQWVFRSENKQLQSSGYTLYHQSQIETLRTLSLRDTQYHYHHLLSIDSSRTILHLFIVSDSQTVHRKLEKMRGVRDVKNISHAEQEPRRALECFGSIVQHTMVALSISAFKGTLELDKTMANKGWLFMD